MGQANGRQAIFITGAASGMGRETARLFHSKGWFVGGYDLGISIPPDWVGHTFLGGDRFEQANFDVGVVTNYENILDVLTENWPGGRNGNYIDSLLMTESGLEILSKLPQELTVL